MNNIELDQTDSKANTETDEKQTKIPFALLRKKRQTKNYILVIVYLFLGYLFSTGIQFLLMYTGYVPFNIGLMNGKHIFYMVLIQATMFIALTFVFVKYFYLPIFPLWGKNKLGNKNMPKELSLGLKLKFYGKELAMSFVYYLLVMFFIGVIVRLIGIEMKQFDGFRLENIKSSAIYFFLAVAVIAPVYEEIVFRGVVLRAFLPSHYQQKKIKTVLAVIISGIIFSAFHFNTSTFLPIFLLSLLLSFLTLRRDGIILSIVIHSFNNFMSAFALLYQITS